MHKKWVFHDTPLEFVQIVYRFASCAIGRHVTLLVVMPMQHKSENMVKSTVSVLFASFCTKELEPRWAAKWSNCMQSHALSINNEISMTNVKNAHCCSSSSLVLPLVCHGALYFRMNTLRKAKLFPWYKSLNSPECAQLSLVYCSVHETIAERLFLHYCVAFCSPYVYLWQKEHEEHTKYEIFSVLSVSVGRTRSPKIRLSVRHLYPKLLITHKKWRFRDTSATCPECAPIRFVRYKANPVTLGLIPIHHESEKGGEKHGFGVICVSLQKGPRTMYNCSVI